MLKDRSDYENEDDVDLTGIIHEYEQDNELRRKIDALKKQKEEEKKASQPINVLDQLAGMKEEESLRPSRDQGMSKQGIPDIRVDDTMVDKTRVGFVGNEDKTLVIMGKKQRVQYDSAFDEDLEDNRTTSFNKDDDDYFDYDDEFQEDPEIEETTEEDEEDDDDNLLSHIKEHRKEKANKEDDGEEQDNTKMNKIISYFIIGFIVICVLVGAFFGVNYVTKTFFGNHDKSKPTETTKPKKEPQKEPSVVDKPSKKEEAKPIKNLKDNSAKVAQLNKQLDLYQSQLDTVKKDIVSVNNDIDAANKELDGYKELITQAATYQQQANDIKIANEALKQANTTLENASSDAEKQAAQVVVDKANTQLQTALQNGSYDDLLAKAKEKNEEYKTKSTAAKKNRDDAKEKLQDLQSKQDSLENNIASLTTELGQYH